MCWLHPGGEPTDPPSDDPPHPSATITLNVYTHLLDDARHAREIRAQMAVSPFARLLEPNDKAVSTGTVLQMRNRRNGR